MTTRDTPRQRLNSAEAQIRYLTNEIRYYDQLASTYRKDREKQKAKRDRAIKAIEREASGLIFGKGSV